jgi:hypothetical protein
LTDRLAGVIASIDEANAQDPNRLTIDGVSHPKELLHSQMVTTWVRRFDPEPSDVQLIAARAHHLRRWTVPRSDYPDGRAGYLRWRRDLGKRHRDDVAELMAAHGYDEVVTAEVGSIMAKTDLGSKPEVQVHEDALCMVFLETQLDALVERIGAEKAAQVVAKTLRKMSPTGIAAAQTLSFSMAGDGVVSQAIELSTRAD